MHCKSRILVIEEERRWGLKENNKNYKEEKNQLGVRRQKFRIKWLTFPISHTRFFHLTAIARRRRNAIGFLKKEVWKLDCRQEIEIAFTYFENLFKSSNPQFLDEIQNLIQLTNNFK